MLLSQRYSYTANTLSYSTAYMKMQIKKNESPDVNKIWEFSRD